MTIVSVNIIANRSGLQHGFFQALLQRNHLLHVDFVSR